MAHGAGTWNSKSYSLCRPERKGKEKAGKGKEEAEGKGPSKEFILSKKKKNGGKDSNMTSQTGERGSNQGQSRIKTAAGGKEKDIRKDERGE